MKKLGVFFEPITEQMKAKLKQTRRELHSIENRSTLTGQMLNVVYFHMQAVPSVRGFLFKDLKQCLRKEHCDVSLSFFFLINCKDSQ